MVQVEIGDEVLVRDSLGGLAVVRVVGYSGDDILVEGFDGLVGFRRPGQIVRHV